MSVLLSRFLALHACAGWDPPVTSTSPNLVLCPCCLLSAMLHGLASGGFALLPCWRAWIIHSRKGKKG